MQVSQVLNTEVALIYRKADGHIVRASSLSRYVVGRITENDMHILFPNIDDLNDFKMVLVKGKQYLEIDRYRVEVDAEGNFIGIVEKADILSPFSSEEVAINPSLLDREVNIVISVLSVIDDPARLLKYKDLEEKGQNRPEVINFFTERGI